MAAVFLFCLAVLAGQTNSQCLPRLPFPQLPLPQLCSPQIATTPMVTTPVVSTVIDNSVSNALANALQLLIVSNLIENTMNCAKNKPDCDVDIFPVIDTPDICDPIPITPCDIIQPICDPIDIIPIANVDCGNYYPVTDCGNFYPVTDCGNFYPVTDCGNCYPVTVNPCDGPNFYPIVNVPCDIPNYYPIQISSLGCDPTFYPVPNCDCNYYPITITKCCDTPNYYPVTCDCPNYYTVSNIGCDQPNVCYPTFGPTYACDNVAPVTAEVVFPTSIPAQLACNFAYMPNVPCVSVNVDPWSGMMDNCGCGKPISNGCYV